MKAPLRVLHLEDDVKDAELVQAALETEHIACEVVRVEIREDFAAKLAQGGFDIIFSDFALPAFDGISALEFARKQHQDLPFIFISGTMGEESAIESLKNGATDYVLKDRLSRLGPAVKRAMLEVEARAERKRLEAQFIEAQKMEVLGQLAGGVAHDFNNVLAVVMGCSDLILRKLPANDPLHREVDEIVHAANRAVGLTRQLLAFSRKQVLQPVVLDLNEVVTGMDKMLRHLIGENIDLQVIGGLELGRVEADPGYVGQVLMNLVVNARDAMGNGGTLTVETKNVTLDEASVRAHDGAKPGDYVILSVADTGTGMTDEVRARLFEAFFTTKPKGKGTGLGLATCHSIVKQCGGHIDVDSELNKGTTFKVYFPRIKHAVKVPARPAATQTLRGGTETLLLVEDEPSVCHMAAGALRAQGYNVLQASNGQEGLRVAKESENAQIRLVITDVIMPHMGGKVMADWLKSSYPDLKVLFTSGYTDDQIADHGVLEPGVAFLPKPYTLVTLNNKIREMLDN